ncbi:hypothetical protein DNC80_07735 [Flavobacterium sp. SOK18b]|uniref:hypothetical protein n=1 Tax=Flavobacterium sp. SOK18b TaxID=797900 RepID=UPI0015FA07E3|nr:hypothetical protein [Flavobacterium sp. SOK18b]MBB1193559.1 hypothetical protein [Flavobacterium sp. SOK18b]
MSENNRQCVSFYDKQAQLVIDNKTNMRFVEEDVDFTPKTPELKTSISTNKVFNKKKPWLVWILLAAIIYGTAEDDTINAKI